MSTKKKFLTLILAFFYLPSCSNVDLSVIKSGSVSKRTQSVSSGKLIIAGDKLFVNIRINNSKKKFLFLLDTGATVSVIDTKIAKEFVLQREGSIDIMDATEDTSQIAISKLNIDVYGARVEATPVSIFDISKLYPKLDGILGHSFLRNFNVTIDFKKRLVSFATQTNKDDFKLDYQYKLKLYHSSLSPPYIRLLLDDKFIVNAVVDTGAPYIYLPSKYIKKLAKTEKKIKLKTNVSMAGMNGNVSDVDVIKVSKIAFGFFNKDLIIKDALVFIPKNTSFMALIGNLFWKNYLVKINYLDGFLYLKKQNDIDYIDDIERFGLSIYLKNERIYVKSFEQINNKTSRPDIEKEDEIITVNGQASNEVGVLEYLEYINKKTLYLRLSRNGKLHDVILEKETVILTE
jgi:predicted aspartyl protease